MRTNRFGSPSGRGLGQWTGVAELPQWMSVSGSGSYQDALIDADDNIVAVGDDDSTGCITKIDYDGNVLFDVHWQQRFGAPLDQVRVDGSGNYYVLGDIGNITQTLAKFTSSGSLSWVIGVFATTSFALHGDEPVIVMDGNSLQKVDSTGAAAWRFDYDVTGVGGLSLRGIAVDGGDIYGVGGGDNWLVKTDDTGAVAWLYDTDGCTSGTADFAGGYLYTFGWGYDGGSQEFYATKYDTSGSPQWRRKVPQSAAAPRKVTADGGLWIPGQNATTWGTANKITTAGADGAFIAKFQRPGGGEVQVNKVLPHPSGDVFVVGSTSETIPRRFIARLPADTSFTQQVDITNTLTVDYADGYSTSSASSPSQASYAATSTSGTTVTYSSALTAGAFAPTGGYELAHLLEI